MRSRTINKTDRFILSKRVKRGSGKIYYQLECNQYYNFWEFNDYERVRDIIDPTRNRAGRYGKSWKYSNRNAAQKDLTMLLMCLGNG